MMDPVIAQSRAYAYGALREMLRPREDGAPVATSRSLDDLGYDLARAWEAGHQAGKVAGRAQIRKKATRVKNATR